MKRLSIILTGLILLVLIAYGGFLMSTGAHFNGLFARPQPTDINSDAAVRDYYQRAGAITQEVGTHLRGLSTAIQSSSKSGIIARQQLLHREYTNLSTMTDVPPRAAGFHRQLVDAVAACDSAATNLRQAVQDDSQILMERAVLDMQTCNRKIQAMPEPKV